MVAQDFGWINDELEGLGEVVIVRQLLKIVILGPPSTY